MQYLKFLVTLFILLSSLCIAQPSDFVPIESGIWVPVGAGLPGKAERAVVVEDALFVLYSEPNVGTNLYEYGISKWNGNSWTPVTQLRCNAEIYSFAAYKGELYVGGYFDHINETPSTAGLAKWNGSTWSRVGGGLKMIEAAGILTMTVYRGELYCGGYFEKIGSLTTTGIARWNGNQWKDVGGGVSGIFQGTEGGSVTSLEEFDGELYAGGSFMQAGNTRANGIARWNGSRWADVGGGVDREITEMATFGSHLVAFGLHATRFGGAAIQQSAMWDGTSWKPGPVANKQYIDNWLGATRMLEYENAFIAILFDGRGIIDDGTGVMAWDGIEWRPIRGLDAPPTFIVEYRGEIYAGGYLRTANGIPTNHIARLCRTSECISIAGRVFDDRNGNCVQDAGEGGLAERIIEALPGPYYAVTNRSGGLFMDLPPGTYSIRLAPAPYWDQICPAFDHQVVIQDSGKWEGDASFAVRRVADIRDVRTSVVSGPARAGRTLEYAVTCRNIGTVAVDGTLRFMYDPALSFVSSRPLHTRESANILEWDIRDLPVGATRTVYISMMIPTSAARGTELCASSAFDIEGLDLGIDYRDSSCIRVTGSYDPNDIAVVPFGIEENGEITPHDSILTYTVRFQNTGNDTAFRVVVVDTLSPHLDVKSITTGAASHPFSFTISGRNILRWTFDDIMLPDSGASEPGSHGFFKYNLHLKPGLAGGTEIPNRVSIYFDHNEPVATNTVVSIIGASSSVPMEEERATILLYPNPARDRLTVRGNFARETVDVRNMLGEVVRTEEIGDAMTIDISDLPPGTYFLMVLSEEGKSVARFTVVR